MVSSVCLLMRTRHGCRSAEQANWIQFSAQTEWFFQVAWDLGLASLSSGGRVLGILAASDTD